MPKKESSWIDNLQEHIQEIKDALWSKSSSFTCGFLKPSQVEVIKNKIQERDFIPRKNYVEIRLESMRAPFKRVIGREYYGTVHSFITLNSLAGSGQAKFDVVTTPGALQKVDPQNIKNVIVRNIPLLGTVPYRGGDVNIEAGVFSVMEKDLIAPFLKVVQSISETAGVSVVGQAMPFIQPIENAIYQLLGASETKLEIGIKEPVNREGYLVAVANSEKDFLPSLKLKDDGKLYKGTDEVKDPYMVLTVRTTKNREDYSIIPEILKALQELYAGIRTGTEESINQFFEAFSLVTRGCLDLLPEDAEKIINQTYDEIVKPALEAAQKPKPKSRTRARPSTPDEIRGQALNEAKSFL